MLKKKRVSKIQFRSSCTPPRSKMRPHLAPEPPRLLHAAAREAPLPGPSSRGVPPRSSSRHRRQALSQASDPGDSKRQQQQQQQEDRGQQQEARGQQQQQQQKQEEEEYLKHIDEHVIERPLSIAGRPLNDLSPFQDFDQLQKLWGRIAVLILAATLVGERLTGKGFVEALDQKINVPLWEVKPLLLAFAAFFLWAATRPYRKPPAEGRATTSKMTRSDVVQLWIRRLACVTLGGTIAVESLTGKGVLALLQVETGKKALSEVEAGVIFIALLMLTSDDLVPEEDD